MKKILTILLILSVAGASAQVDSIFRFEREWAREIVDFSVDNLGNLYILNKKDELKKISSNGDSMGVFNAVRRYGQLYTIDVTNPLKILLYYQDFGTVLMLDRFLNVVNRIDLRKLNLFQVKAVGTAYDNNFWVFDELEGKLKRISEEGRMLDQTNDFRLLFDTLPSPTTIIDQDGLVYLYDNLKGVYVFDYYGALKNRLPLRDWQDFTVAARSIYGRKQNSLFKYEPGTLNLQEAPMPAFFNKASRIRITPNKIYVLVDGVLQTYLIR